MSGRGDSGQRCCGSQSVIRTCQCLIQALRISIAKQKNQSLRRLLPKGNQFDPGHDGALDPAVAETQSETDQRDFPAHAQPGQTAKLAVSEDRAPFLDAIRFPVDYQACEGCTSAAFFLTQFSGFPTGQQICRPAAGGTDIIQLTGMVKAGQQW